MGSGEWFIHETKVCITTMVYRRQRGRRQPFCGTSGFCLLCLFSGLLGTLFENQSQYFSHRNYRSIILYIACIMSFIWRTNAGSTQPASTLSDTSVLLIRVFMSAVLGLGFIYSALVLKTFSRYGEAMDKAWKRRISGWVQEKIHLHGAASTHRTHSYAAPGLHYPHLPEPYAHSIPSRASNEGDHLSTLHASLSITRRDQESASISRRNVSRASRLNPPMYAPGPGDSKLEDEQLPSKRHRHQVAADNPTHKTGFCVLSRPEKQLTAQSALHSADIQQSNAPEAIEDCRDESEHEIYASEPSSPVDGERVDAL